MRNPFFDFSPGTYQKKANRVERVAKEKQDVLRPIMEGYLELVEQQIKDLAWIVEHGQLVKTYASALERIRGLQFDQDKIEAFCEALDRTDGFPYRIPGPAGIYLSAMINQCQAERIQLRLADRQPHLHFLGYGLLKGKTLILQGHGGDFTGAGLGGGRLVVQGSTGNWCGAGMIDGEIRVEQHTGQSTGEWMQGGEIRVDGQIGGIGRDLIGGRIYHQGRRVAGGDRNDFHQVKTDGES